MAYETERTEEEIQKQYDLACKTDGYSRWPSMSYESGVMAALDWILGVVDDVPVEKE
jgi:hypothetical protein